MDDEFVQDKEILEFEIAQDKKELKLMVKGFVYGSFLLVLATTIHVIVKAILGI